MKLTTYKVKRNGREYEYSYDRSKYSNNSIEYNHQYWEEHKKDLSRKAKLSRIEKNLSRIPKESVMVIRETVYIKEVFISEDLIEIFLKIA